MTYWLIERLIYLLLNPPLIQIIQFVSSQHPILPALGNICSWKVKLLKFDIFLIKGEGLVKIMGLENPNSEEKVRLIAIRQIQKR